MGSPKVEEKSGGVIGKISDIVKEKSDRGHDQYYHDYRIVEERTLPSRPDWEKSETYDPLGWTYFEEHGKNRKTLKENRCEEAYHRYATKLPKEDCRKIDPNRVPNAAQHLKFRDCPYKSRNTFNTLEASATRACYYGFYKKIDVPDKADQNLNDYDVDMSMRSVYNPSDPPHKFHTGPAFWMGFTVKQKDCVPDKLHYYNWWNDLPPGRLQAFPPQSKRKTTKVTAFNGPNTYLDPSPPQPWAKCNWHQYGFRNVLISCKYVDYIVFFVAFSDFVYPVSAPSDWYEGFIGEISIDIKEIQQVRDAEEEERPEPYAPLMERWVDHYYVKVDDAYYG